MEFKELLVIIPHSGILIPAEIPLDSLSTEFPRLMRNVDWYTNWLYDFRDILGNSQLEFPYCSLLLEANRDPQQLEDSTPLKDVFGEPLYKSGLEPDQAIRKLVSRKYLHPFHRNIATEIVNGKSFMLDAHSTISSRGVEEDQIELMNFQVIGTNNKATFFCPDVFIETYATELSKRLPGTRVTINESRYNEVYGHICGKHSVNSNSRVGRRIPAILQETSQQLYLNNDGTPSIESLETLRRAFAEALFKMIEKVLCSV